MTVFTAKAKVNGIVWITSLRPGEEGVTRRVLDDLEPLLTREQIDFEKVEPANAAQLLAALDGIAERARNGFRPILHLDLHGDLDRGLLIAATDEFVEWAAVVTKLRAINEATGNNLCVISGACFSLRILHQVSILKASPFFVLMAPEEEVAAGFLEDNVPGFYEDVFRDEDLVGAYRRRLAGQLRLTHSEALFAIALRRYVREHATGRGARQRREALLSDAIDRGLLHNRASLRRARKRIKAVVRPSVEQAERFGRVFLCGRRPAAPYSVIHAPARPADEK